MKKFLMFYLVVSMLIFAGCDLQSTSNPNQTTTDSETITSSITSEATQTSTELTTEENLTVKAGNYTFEFAPGTTFGTFNNPNPIGQKIRIAYDCYQEGKTEKFSYDYSVLYEEVITGNEAKQKLRELCNEELNEIQTYVIERFDIYVVKVKIENSVNEPMEYFLSIVDEEGNIPTINVDGYDGFSIKDYWFGNGNMGWDVYAVPKDLNVRPAVIIESYTDSGTSEIAKVFYVDVR